MTDGVVLDMDEHTEAEARQSTVTVMVAWMQEYGTGWVYQRFCEAMWKHDERANDARTDDR